MIELNEQQHLAVYSNSRTILCLAGAGAGKTATMLARIERLISEGVDPSSILALTFTNAAAFEMKERYKKIPGINLSITPEFRTFHSFCYSLIVKDIEIRKALGYVKIPELCDDPHLKEIKTKVKMALGCKLSTEQLDKDVPLSKSEQEEKKLYQKALIKEIKKENVITFDIMCYNVCDLFVKHMDCIERYRDKYHYIFIDEFQDTDRRQFKFASSFPADTNFWLCADALQNIYSFRGTTNEYVKQLAVDPNWEVIKLHKNYRSTRNICQFANKFSHYAKDEYRIEMEGQRDGDDVEVIYGSNSSYNEPIDEDHLSMLIDKLNENKNETAILCRTNRECAAVKSALTNAGVQFSSKSKSTDSLNILESALDNDYMLEWLSTRLEPKDYGDYIRLAAQIENPDIRWFLNLYGPINAKVKKAAEKVIEVRNIVSSNDDPKLKFNQITKLLRVKTKCQFDEDRCTSNRDLVESIRDQVQELEEAQIYVGTIHSVKGLEYDTVYVMGVNDKMFRLGTEEMNNLYYVAVTRARNHLIVFRR